MSNTTSKDRSVLDQMRPRVIDLEVDGGVEDGRYIAWNTVVEMLSNASETTAQFDVVEAAKFAEEIIRRVCELPDRNSPEDEPEALVCSPSELEGCIVAAMEIRWERDTGRSVLNQSPPKAAVNPPGCICRYQHPSDPMCTAVKTSVKRPA